MIASVWFIKSDRNRSRSKEVLAAHEIAPLFIALAILSTTIFFLIGFKYGGHSPWIYIYRFVPGAGAIRAVSRYVIFLTLPMSIAFAYGLHGALKFAAQQQSELHRRVLAIPIVLMAVFGILEQFGVPKINGTGFSTSVEYAYLKAMAAKLPNDCAAFYIAPGADANHSTAEYQYDAMMISALSRIKTLNASSSQFPRDWNMYFVKNPDYESNVKQWIDSQRISGKVCRLEIGPQVEVFDPKTKSLIDDPEFFVRQLYRDFTGGEPDATVIDSQVAKLRTCKIGDERCERPFVALNIFLTTGFHERGFFILRMYEASLGRMPSYQEFMDAMRRYSDKDRMVAEFAKQQDRDEQSLRQQIDSDELVRKLGNRSFVVLHYFGYLQRDPDPSGLAGWTQVLDMTGDSTRITSGFINSVEYRQRFLPQR